MDAGESVTAAAGLKRRSRVAGDQKEEATSAAEMTKASASVAASARGGRRKAAAVAAAASSPPWTIVFGVLLSISTVFLILLAMGIVSLPIGDHRGPRAVEQLEDIAMPLINREELGRSGERWTEIISWEPRASVYHNFLTKEECAYLIEVAMPRLMKSTVWDDEAGKSVDSEVRTSPGTFLDRGQDEIIQEIEQRIAEYTFIPVEHGEGLYVLQHGVGHKYEAHFDYFVDDFNLKNGGQRTATVLMYLSDVEEGGETVFPDAKTNSSSLPYYNELSGCGKMGLAVKPKMGDVLLFWSTKPDSTMVDPSSLHGACPVIRGHKWCATKWLHVNEYKVNRG